MLWRLEGVRSAVLGVCREAARAEEAQEVTEESQHKAAQFTAQVHRRHRK